MTAGFLSIYIPVVLTVLMFGMGLQLVASDFLRLARFPKAVLVGVVGQIVVLPSIAWLMVYFLPLPLAVSAGIVILAACPGGIASNSLSFLANADVALSVTLTAISSLLALVTLPILVGLGLDIIQLGMSEANHADAIRLPLGDTIAQLVLVLALPLSAGMIVRRYAERLAVRSDRWFRMVNLAGLLVLLTGAFIVGMDFLLANFQVLLPVLLGLNLASMLGGYLLARTFGLAMDQRLTITIELGIHNVGIGALVVLNLLHQPDWIVVPSVYSILMMLTGFAFVAGLRLHRGRAHSQPVS